MLGKIITKIPVLNTLAFFPLKVHAMAGKKCAFSLIFSLSPILIALLFSKAQEGGGAIDYIKSAFSMSEQYVYAAAFITPLFYLIYERFQESEKSDPFSDKISSSIKDLFPGYGITMLAAAGVLLVTVAAFSVSKANTNNMDEMLIASLSPVLAPWFFIFSIYCLYISILDQYFDSSAIFQNDKKKQKNLADEFSSMLKGD
jgi:hypothetical protein